MLRILSVIGKIQRVVKAQTFTYSVSISTFLLCFETISYFFYSRGSAYLAAQVCIYFFKITFYTDALKINCNTNLCILLLNIVTIYSQLFYLQTWWQLLIIWGIKVVRTSIELLDQTWRKFLYKIINLKLCKCV